MIRCCVDEVQELQKQMSLIPLFFHALNLQNCWCCCFWLLFNRPVFPALFQLRQSSHQK